MPLAFLYTAVEHLDCSEEGGYQLRWLQHMCDENHNMYNMCNAHPVVLLFG